MSTIAPTTPTFASDPIAVSVVTNGNQGTETTISLTTKFGAWLFVRIGRRGATALTISGIVHVRRSLNQTVVHPHRGYDRVSSLAAVNSTTIAAGGSSGTNTVGLTSASGFAAGDTVCMHSDDGNANRVEFARVLKVASTTLTLDANLKTTHNANDRITNGADVFDPIWLPGGDIYYFNYDNASGQDLVFESKLQTYDSDTVV